MAAGIRSSHDHRVVPGAAGHPVGGQPRLLDCAFERLDERRVHRHRGLIEPRMPRCARPAARSQSVRQPPEAPPPRRRAGDRRRAARRGCSGTSPAMTLAAPAWLRFGRLLRRAPAACLANVRPRESIRRRRHCVASSAHRRGTGVIGAPGESESRRASKPTMASTTADRQAQSVEHGALLDVEFEVADGASADARPLPILSRIETVVTNRVTNRSRHGCRSWPARHRPTEPTSARLPMKGTPKRTPSSSEKPTTSMVNGSGAGRTSSTSASRARRRGRRRTRPHAAPCRGASR